MGTSGHSDWAANRLLFSDGNGFYCTVEDNCLLLREYRVIETFALSDKTVFFIKKNCIQTLLRDKVEKK